MSAFYAMNRNKFFILIPMPPLAAQIEMKNAGISYAKQS